MAVNKMKIDFDNLIISEDKVSDEEYESHFKTKWTIGVDKFGYVFVIKAPNIHPSFFDNGDSAEYIGLPITMDVDAGVYEITCNFVAHRDWESGLVDDYEFEVEESKLLYGIR